MNTTKENNKKIMLIWLGFLLVTIGLGLNISYCLDYGAAWRGIVGLVSFAVLVFGTVKFGQWVRAYYVDLESKETLAEAEKAKETKKKVAKK